MRDRSSVTVFGVTFLPFLLGCCLLLAAYRRVAYASQLELLRQALARQDYPAVKGLVRQGVALREAVGPIRHGGGWYYFVGTPLIDASRRGAGEMVRLVLANGVSLRACDRHGLSALDVVSNDQIRNLLVKAGVQSGRYIC